MYVGHACIAPDVCLRCDGPLVRIVIGWNQQQGWLSAVDPCPACVKEAKRDFGV
jgi:hypothetical protein